MGYKITGGRTVGAPRASASSASGAKVTGGRTVGGPRTGEEAILSIKGAKPADAGRPGFTPIRVVLDALSVPNTAIGKAIRDPRGSLSFSAIDAFKNKERDSIGRSVEGRGLLNWVPEGKWRTVTKLGLDIGLDPTTYVTLGFGGAARGLGSAGVKRVGTEAIQREVARTGGAPLDLKTLALASARDQRAISEAGRAFRVGVAVPFTRASEKVLFSSKGLQKALDKVGDAITSSKPGELGSLKVNPSRGIDQRVNQVRQDIRRYKAIQERAQRRALAMMQDEAFKIEKGLGMKRGEAAIALARHIDDPTKYTVAPELEDLAERLRTFQGKVYESDVKAGIKYTARENYVSHLGATPKDRRRIEEVFARSANSLDDAWFLNPRVTDTLDEFEAIAAREGFTPELNIFKLLERRGRGSLEIQSKKALDDALAEVYGKTRLVDVPDTAPAAARAEAASARLAAVSAPRDVAGAQAAAAAAREAERDARAAYQASLRTGDPAAVRSAQRELVRYQSQVDESLAVPREVLGDIPPEVGDQAVAQATRKADRAVERAEKRVKVAQRQGSKAEIAQARKVLARAEATRRQSRLALERARAGYVGSPREVVAATKETLKSDRVLAKAEAKAGAARLLNEDIKTRPGEVVSAEEFRELAETWRAVGTATKYHDGTLLPPEIADSITRIHQEILDSMQQANASGFADMRQYIGKMTGQWKALALLSPGYHGRNIWSDSLQSYWAGSRNPQSYVQAAKILRARSRAEKGLEAATGTIKIRGERQTYAEAVEEMRAFGVIDTGQVRADLLSSADPLSKGRRWVPSAPGTGKPTEWSGEFGDWRENLFRAGLYLELRKGGRSPSEAAQRVREYLYDYGEVGEFVQAARRFWLPFITYQSKAIPNVGRMLLERPGRLASVDKTTQASTEASGNPDLSLLPTGQRASFAVPVPAAWKERVGLPGDQPFLVTPERLFSYGSLNMLDPRPKALRRNVMAGLLGPVPRIAIEVPTQTNLYFGSDYAKRARAPRIIDELARRGVPVPGYGEKKDFYTNAPGTGYSPTLDAFLRLVPAYGQQASLSGPTDQARIGWMRYLAGFPASPYDRARRQAQVEAFPGSD